MNFTKRTNPDQFGFPASARYTARSLRDPKNQYIIKQFAKQRDWTLTYDYQAHADVGLSGTKIIGVKDVATGIMLCTYHEQNPHLDLVAYAKSIGAWREPRQPNPWAQYPCLYTSHTSMTFVRGSQVQHVPFEPALPGDIHVAQRSCEGRDAVAEFEIYSMGEWVRLVNIYADRYGQYLMALRAEHPTVADLANLYIRRADGLVDVGIHIPPTTASVKTETVA